MKTRLMLASGFLGILVLFSSTAFSGVASSKKDKSDSKKPTIALHRGPSFEKIWFSEIKNALDKEGFTTKVVSDANDLKGDGIDLGISFSSHFGTEDILLVVGVCHNENKLLAKCMKKQLARRTKLATDLLDVDNVHFMPNPGDPIVLILVEPTDIEKHCDRYAQGIVEGVEEYMDELEHLTVEKP